MAKSHVISALVGRHLELQENIKHHQEIILNLQNELLIINRAITIFD